MDKTRQRADQSPAAATKHQHSITGKFLAGRQRMPKKRNALVGGDQVDNGLHTQLLGFASQQTGNLILGYAGLDRADSGIHRLSAQPSQVPKTGDFLG